MFRGIRLLFLVTGLLFLTSNILGASFGTFPYQIEKQSSDLELEYRIGFINPSSNPVEVSISSSESEEYNAAFSEKEFQISPSNTDNPSGSGWYHLGGGKYTKIHQTSFRVNVSRYREDNSLSIPIRIEAAEIRGNTANSGSRSKIVQVRNYNYRAEIDPSLRPQDRPETDSDSNWRENFWQEDNSGSEEDFNLERDKSSNQEQQKDNIVKEKETRVKSSDKTESSSGNTLVNKTTLILLVGIIVSLSYILMEV